MKASMTALYALADRLLSPAARLAQGRSPESVKTLLSSVIFHAVFAQHFIGLTTELLRT